MGAEAKPTTRKCWVEWTESGCPVRVTLLDELAVEWRKQGMIVIRMVEQP